MYQFDSVSDFHRFVSLPPPEHPLISLVDYADVRYPRIKRLHWRQGFYAVGLKRDPSRRFDYGRQPYDFDEGVLAFVAAGQEISLTLAAGVGGAPSGYLLLIHPDFLLRSALQHLERRYAFFGYAVREALHLAPREEQRLSRLFAEIRGEYRDNLDRFSVSIIVSQLELLFNYAERYYERQFLTRRPSGHRVLAQLGRFLDERLAGEPGASIPTVAEAARAVHLSPNYLSGVVRALTGHSTQQLIQDRLVREAKRRLTASGASVSAIAYDLGFGHPSSFSKLFKHKTQLSPTAFRRGAEA